jgi:pyruvate kinase
MLIATLPSANKTELVERMYSHPSIDGARYNVGIRTTYTPKAVLTHLKKIAEKHGKKLWIDLKGRQLRITKWADPTYGDIELNRKFEVDLPAKIFFRGNHWSNVVEVDRNKVVVDPDPKQAVGAGQAVNIIGSNLRIKGKYLTKRDKQYIEVAKELGIHDYMLSFVEQEKDLTEVRDIDPEARLVLKIESPKGLSYVAQDYSPSEDCNLMAARDDLMVNIGENKAEMLKALEWIVKRDPKAIAASHIFTSLSTLGYLTMADISDLRFLHDLGYQNFMFSDDVSHRCFDEAVKAWLDFQEVHNG